jgi:hypothetical protein
MFEIHLLSNFTLEQPQGVFCFTVYLGRQRNTSEINTSATGEVDVTAQYRWRSQCRFYERLASVVAPIRVTTKGTLLGRSVSTKWVLDVLDV